MIEGRGRKGFLTRNYAGGADMRSNWTLGLAVSLFLPIAATTTFAQNNESISSEFLDHIVRASVFIRVERVFHYEGFDTSGSGFFVHRDGYVITNRHVVADQIEANLWGRERDIGAKVTRLAAVINSGTPNERVLPAKIVALDRKRDLALLHVAMKPRAWIDVTTVDDVRIGEHIWSAGFPFGDILAMEKQTDSQTMPNPEVSLTSGMVTSLRRDSQGRLVMIQTDAAVNPGSSGSLMVNSEGHLVGVLFAKIQGGHGIGFGVSPDRVREFIASQFAKVVIEPRVILSPPQPIRVTIAPLLLDFDSGPGTLSLRGTDIDPLDIPLRPIGSGFEATVNFPERIAGKQRPSQYFLTVSAPAKTSDGVFQRRFALDAVPESFETLQSARDPAHVMEDRKVLSHEMKIEDYNKSRQVQKKTSKSLADAAKSVKLKTDSSGSVVVDNNAVGKIGGTSYDGTRYKYLDKPATRSLAQRYDRLSQEIEETLERINSRQTSSDNRQSLSRHYGELMREKGEIVEQLAEQSVRKCSADPFYFVEDGNEEKYPCRFYHEVF
jgi:S1-C subfamily serine protease